MNVSNLKKFKELLAAINEINGVTSPVNYLLISKGNVTLKEGLSLYDLHSFDYIMVLGEYRWKNGSFVNTSAKMLGLFNKELDIIEQMPISESINVIGLEFTTYPSSYYNEYKPILVISKNGNEPLRIKLDTNDGWSEDFPKLFEQAKINTTN